jgi:hypothetical protein
MVGAAFDRVLITAHSRDSSESPHRLSTTNARDMQGASFRDRGYCTSTPILAVRSAVLVGVSDKGPPDSWSGPWNYIAIACCSL